MKRFLAPSHIKDNAYVGKASTTRKLIYLVCASNYREHFRAYPYPAKLESTPPDSYTEKMEFPPEDIVNEGIV